MPELVPHRSGWHSARRGEHAFTLIELLVVVAIIALLAGLLLPALARAKEAGRATVCKNNMRQITFGLLLYADDSAQFFPWAGDVDRNADPDWVWGGQNDTAFKVPAQWSSPGFGFHPEAGSVFVHVTGAPRMERAAYYAGGSTATYERTHTNLLHAVYLCPSTGAHGRALRVNFSMNSRFDRNEQLEDGRRTGPRGVQLTALDNPAQKVLLVNEDPATMRNASFAPRGTAGQGNFITHSGWINVGFADGHLENMRHRKVLEIQQPGQAALWFDP